MKVYKVEIFIVDHDQLGADEIRDVIENARYPNHCIYPDVKSIIEKDIGEWSDDNPLNKPSTADAEYKRLFNQ